MIKVKKLLSLTLVASLLTFMLTGCSSNETTETTAPVNNETAVPESKPGGGLGGGSFDDSAIKNKFLGISYSTLSETQKLNIYLPNEGEGPFPVIVAIHGGAFKMGDRTGGDLAPMLEGVNRGYAVVTVDYRLSGEAIFPAAVNDVKAAIRFIRQNSEKYGLNPDRIATWGDSAGGNLAAIAGTTGGTDELYDPLLGMTDVSDKITAVVDWFGPLDFLKMDEQFEASGINPAFGKTSAATSPESAYIGQLITEVPEKTALADPSHYVSADDPAFFIQHGTMDANVPKEQSINFADYLKKVISEEKVTLILIEGAAHGGDQFSSNENLDLVYEFLDKYMK